MPKKTARAAKPSQQRSKEEQWRRRMAAQGRPGSGSAVVDAIEAADAAIEDGDLSNEEVTPLASTRSTTAPRSAATTRSAARAETRAQSTATATAQRRATGTGSYSQRSTSARARMAAATMSVEEEMHYIKADIRKLVVLTGVCMIVIIALAFLLPMILA
jgi:hypothetical protein